ncbi:MAG: hypothetical protein AB1556_08220 [Bacillota bacterium]
MSAQVHTSQFIPIEKGRLSEFRFNEPTTGFVLSASPVVLAATVVLVDDVSDRVWLNGTVNWQISLAGAGTASVLFEILRNGTVIYSAVQSISSFFPVSPFIVFNQAQLQHVDTTPITTPGLAPVLYQLRATVLAAPPGTISTLFQVLSAAEVEANLP